MHSDTLSTTKEYDKNSARQFQEAPGVPKQHTKAAHAKASNIQMLNRELSGPKHESQGLPLNPEAP